MEKQTIKGKLDSYMKNYKPPKFLFSRLFYSLIIVLLQILIVVLLMLAAGRYSLWVWVGFELFGIIICFFVVNDQSDPAYKVSWMFFIIAVPFIGPVFYLLFANHRIAQKFSKIVRGQLAEHSKAIDSYNKKDDITFDEPKLADAIAICNYLKNEAKMLPFNNTDVTYYPFGDLALRPMVEALKNAKHYIFIEYFIIKPGKFWNSILEVLLEKAKEGVDVRLIYDDFGCSSTLTPKYYKYLRENGIKAYKFNRVKPILDVRMNNRDHRKILVIDGYIGFTGGINLADEYINEEVRFGKWKDNCIRLVGEAVYGLTTLFLASYKKITKSKEEINYQDYLPNKYMNVELIVNRDSIVQPYGVIPHTKESIAANAYELLVHKAKRYIYISTPYLILNSQLQHALIQATKNGVKVRILTPHIPDKKIVFQLTRSNYKPLVDAGAEVYEYTPGFVHAKMLVVDGEMASIGTVNFDYRSLFLHFENNVFLYHVPAIQEIVNDFENTFLVSEVFTKEMIKNTKWYKKVIRFILRIFAPIM